MILVKEILSFEKKQKMKMSRVIFSEKHLHVFFFIFTVTAVSHNCLSYLFMHFPGFTESVMNKTVPEILFLNTDGYLPDIQINTEGNSSIISFLTCQRVPENTNVFNAEPKNAFDPQQYDVNYPFIVLTPDDEEV